MKANRPLRIGILGSRGIPNAYGGYEQFAQHLAPALVERGHRVWVYSSSLHPYQQPEWRGVRIVHRLDPENRLGTFGQFLYDYHCLRDARSRNYDVLMQLGYTSNTIWIPLWPRKAVNIIHMDGLEWKRSKYKKPVKQFLKQQEKRAAKGGDVLVADSPAIQDHLQQAYGKKAVYIPYGATTDIRPVEDHLTLHGLQPYRYHLVIARFVPENHLAEIIQAHLAAALNFPLVLIGHPSGRYGEQLRQTFASEQVRFLGGIYQFDRLNSLRYYARLYLHGHSVGGTNPSLLEAMACATPICAHDNVFNRAVLGGDAQFFSDIAQLASILRNPLPAAAYQRQVAANLSKVRENYHWESIVDQFEELFRAVANFDS